jgi:hypothetical protein
MNTYPLSYIFQPFKVFKMNTPFFFFKLQGGLTVQCKGKSYFFARVKVIFARLEIIFARGTARLLILSRMLS